MRVFRSTVAKPFEYVQDGLWRAGTYTYQAFVKSAVGYAFAFQYKDLTWEVFDCSWQLGSGFSQVEEVGFELKRDAIAFKLIANPTTGEILVGIPMLEDGTNKSTPIAHEEDLRGMDGDFHEFIFTRNDTGIAPPTPLSTQENDHVPIDDSVEPPVIWTDNPQGVTKELPFEFVSMREKKNGVWLNFSPPSLWAKWAEDGFSLSLQVQGHFVSHWEGTEKVTEIVGGEYIDDEEVVKVTAVVRKGEKDVTVDELQSRGFRWYVNGFYNPAWDNQSHITLDETYGDGFADFVILSYLVNSLREEVQVEVMNLSEGMDGIGEEFIFIAHDSEVVAPELPQPTDAGYQEDDYFGHWSDDPVSPTEVDQFVWSAKRKKVGGIWEAFGAPSVWTRWVEDGDGILEVIDYYGVSFDSNVLPTTWYRTVPTKGANEYLWNYERILYTDGTYDETEPRVIQGKDAKSISTIVNQYVYSSSDTVRPSSGWKPTIAELGAKPEGYFLWVRDFITYTDGTTSTTDGYVVTDGEDGITIITNQQGHTYRADLNGAIIGSLADGMVELTITSGSTPITCSTATSGGAPTTNGTYRVIRTLGNGITTSSSLSGGKYRITPETLTVDEATVNLEIKIMMGGAVTSYPLILTYRKQFDGADGKSTEFIFKGSTSDTTAPTLPSTSQQDDWYGQGTSNEWNDDLIEPTKTLPYVWASQRKKVDGVWGAFTPPKVWLRWTKDGDDAKSLILSASSSTMACYSTNVAKTGQTITINAKLQNVSGTASFDATPYNASGTALAKITLGGSGNTRTLTNAQWLATFQKVVITATLGSLSDTVTITRLPDGGDGDGITSTTIHYARSSIGTTPPNDGWGTSIPEAIQGWYLWTRTTITYKVAQTTVSYSVSHWAEDGDGIDSTTIHYQKSSSGTAIPGSWLTSIPSPTKGMYLWTRTTTVYKKSPTTVAYSVSYWAEDGDDAKDIRLTATNTQAVIGTNGVTPTQIKVTGSAKNTTISGWSYSVDGGSFTTPPNGVTRAGNVVTINTAVAVWRTLAIKAYNTTDNVDTVITISIVGYGATGEKGKVPIVKEWLNSDTHLNNANVVDYIYYRPTRTWWKLKDAYTSRVATSSPSTTYYEQITYMGALATKVLIAEEANIANFVFKDGKLLSIAGTVNGSPATYSGQAGFVHNIVLDGQTGKIYAEDAEISGVINALSGSIGDLSLYSGMLASYDTSIPVVPLGDQIVLSKNVIGLLSLSGGQPQMDTETSIRKSLITVKRGPLGGPYTYTEIKPDGVYTNGEKLEMGGGGGSDYTHPPTHSASMITDGTLQGVVKAYNNTSYTTKQVRNMILSTGNAVSSQMANGDIWIKYE